MDFDQVRNYWDQRAASDSSAQSTTMDYYLREIEFKALKAAIEKHQPESVMDIGCGDARTTARLAHTFPQITFTGGDYAAAMVANAQKNIAETGIDNLDAVFCDVSRPLPASNMALIYTTRCLINLPSWELQQQALDNISKALSAGGHYIMIENFIEGQDNFNCVRRSLGLPEISVRDHNLFFEREKLLQQIDWLFEVIEEVNISSTYYLVSRGIYSKICQENNIEPDYFDDHHKYAAELPFSGEFGPVRMVTMKRR